MAVGKKTVGKGAASAGRAARRADGPAVSDRARPLIDLFGALFEPAELRAFVQRMKGGAALAAALPGPTTPRPALAAAAVSAIEGAGLLNAALWNDLLRAKPKNERRITTVWEAWAGMEGDDGGRDDEGAEDELLVYSADAGKEEEEEDQW